MKTDWIQKTARVATVIGAGVILCATPSLAQRGGGGGQAGGQAAGGDQAGGSGRGQGRGPQITDPKELAAYQAFAAAKGDKKIQAGNDFVTNYPKSIAAPPVAEQVVQLDYQKQDWPAYYAASDKLFALQPDAASSLAQDAWVIARNFKDGQTEPTLDEAETRAKHALDVLGTMQKPAALTDDQFTQAKDATASQAHSALGLIYAREGKAADVIPQLEQVKNPDSTDLFMLGASYESTGKHASAAAQFKKCSDMPGVLQTPCQQDYGTASKEGPDSQ